MRLSKAKKQLRKIIKKLGKNLHNDGSIEWLTVNPDCPSIPKMRHIKFFLSDGSIHHESVDSTIDYLVRGIDVAVDSFYEAKKRRPTKNDFDEILRVMLDITFEKSSAPTERYFTELNDSIFI